MLRDKGMLQLTKDGSRSIPGLGVPAAPKPTGGGKLRMGGGRGADNDEAQEEEDQGARSPVGRLRHLDFILRY